VPIETLPSAPTLTAVLDDLFGMVAAEVAGAQTAEEGDALRVRAALLAWDGLNDKHRALEVLADAEHPLAPALRLGLAPLPANAASRGSASSSIDQAVGSAFLFARGGYAEAAELSNRAGPIAAIVRRLSLGVLGSWEELVRDAQHDDGTDLLEEGSSIALDRLSDAGAGMALLRRLYETRPHPYVVERLIEARDSAEASEGDEILRRKLQLLEPNAGADRAATLYLLAQELEARGGEAEAEGHMHALLADTAGANGGLTGLAHRAAARLAGKRGDWRRAAEAWEALARDSGSPTFAGAYLRRAAELWDARVGAADRAEPLFRRLHEADAGDATVASALVRLLLKRGAHGEIGAILGRLGGSREESSHGGLLLAAVLDELAGGGAADTIRARWREWAEAVGASRKLTSSDGDVADGARAYALEGVARTMRNGTARRELIELYRGSAPALDVRRGAAYLAVAGSLALEDGLLDVAAALFDEAATREPNDLLVHAGRAILFERTDRHAELATALQALTEIVESTTAQATLHRKLARVSAQHLNDVATAHDSYERLLELEPEDVSVIEAFMHLCAEGGKWTRAIQLVDQAAALAEGDRAAELLRYAGEMSERQLNDDDAAQGYYERALERSRAHAASLASLAALHKKYNRLEPYLTTLRAIVDTDPPRERRIELLLEYARAAERADGAAAAHDFGRAFAAYDEVLRLEPNQPAALQGLERLCRAGAKWAELAEACARAPETLRTLRVRAECYEHLERWGELAKVREAELKLLEAPAEIAAAGRLLADLYEARLHNPEAAVRAWARVSEAAPTEPEPLRALQRLHETAGRHPALAVAIERELALGETLELSRRVELWTRLGDLRRGPLAAPAEAAQAFEEALRLEPRRPELVEQLIEIYKALGRGDDLGRMLDLRAASANNPQQRANVLREKAELREREDDVNGALQAYQQAFAIDPESRACFTAYEKLCYKSERWKAALELYEAAIKLVEEKKSRAYRLSDLYSRRGQLQLQYLGALGEASASYKRVLELDPENDVSQTALERIYSAQSDWAGLIAVYERRAELVKTDARRVEVLRRAARVASAKLHDAAETARLYERLHAVDPTDAETTDTLERHYERAHDLDKLVAMLRTRLSFTAGGEEAIALHLRIAQICEEGLRDADRTIEAYQKILEIAPSNREAIDALGRLYEGTERWAELVEVTRRQIRLVTDRAQKALLYFKCGSVMESKFGKEDDAIRYYDAAIKTSPSCLPAVHGLRDLYLRRQEWARVIQTLELEAKLWTEDKERAGVYAHIGQIYGDRLGDQERSIQYYETALQVDRECLPANKALFDLYSARGDYQQALSLAVVLTQKVAREGDPVERSDFYRKRALVAERTGDIRAAADSLVVALEIRPDNIEALDMLVSLCRAAPDAYDYASAFRELEKLHRKRDAASALARVLVAQASLLELAYDVEGAEQGYLAAVRLAPSDFTVVEPLVALNERLRRFEGGEALIEAFLERATDLAARSAARLRLALLRGEAMMDSEGAAGALRELLDEDPVHKEALFLHAQELYLLGRYAEARRAADRLVEVATSPEHTAPPEELAQYYDYLGRILEAAGDVQGAGRSYRRAVDLDPTYPPACLALARRAAATGDLVQGTRVLADALEAAEQGGNVEAALTLQRSRARFLVNWGELALAAQAFRDLLDRELDAQHAQQAPHAPHVIEDRLAYADLLGRSEQTISMAFGEIERVLTHSPRESQAFRQLAQLYVRVGQPGRAVRVYTLMTLMGILEGSDRPPAVPPSPRRGMLNDELRGQYTGPDVRGVLTEALAAVRESLEEAYPFVVPADAIPLAQVGDPSLRNTVQDLERVFGVTAEVMIAPSLTAAFAVNDLPRPVIYLSQVAAQLPEPERRVLLGYALEALRGGYALITRIGGGARIEVTNLLDQLVRPEGERSTEAHSYIKALPRKAQKALEKLWGTKSKSTLPPGLLGGGAQPQAPVRLQTVPVDQWLSDLERAMRRAGLVASDDLAACARMHLRAGQARGDLTQADATQLAGAAAPVGVTASVVQLVDDLDLVGESVLAIDRGSGLADLVSFYLSEPYHLLRSAIGDAALS
jgi:tetratricopeptide (TPR) repeat protein